MRRHFLYRLLATLLVVVVSPFVFLSPASQALENRLIDAHFALRPRQAPPKSVTVLRLDPRSLRKLGLPISGHIGYARLAEAVEKIAAARPKLIVLDLYFEKTSADEDASERLAKSLASTPTVIAGGVAVSVDTDLQGKQHIELERAIPHVAFVRSAGEVIPMMVRKDFDGVVRKVNLTASDSSFPIEQNPLLHQLRKHVSADLEEPGDHDLINYYGPPYAIPDVPVYKLLGTNGSVPVEYFRDRVVFIGGVDTRNDNPDGGDDSFRTPMSHAPMYGVEIHATVAQNLLDRSWIKRASPQVETFVQSFLLAAFGYLLLERGFALGCIIGGAACVLWAAASFLSFSFLHYFIPGATMIGLAFPVLLIGGVIAKRRELPNSS